jgi:hypothetical protein
MLVVAFIVGLLGALWHLGITAWRARQFTHGHAAVSVALLPLALAGPLAGLLIVAEVAPEAVWAVVPGLVLGRWVAVGPLQVRLEEGAWTR